MSSIVSSYQEIIDEVKGLTISDMEVYVEGGIKEVYIYFDNGYRLLTETYSVDNDIRIDMALEEQFGLYGEYRTLMSYDSWELEYDKDIPDDEKEF